MPQLTLGMERPLGRKRKKTQRAEPKISNRGVHQIIVHLPKDRKAYFRHDFKNDPHVNVLLLNKQQDGSERLRIDLPKFDVSALDWFFNEVKTVDGRFLLDVFPNTKEISESSSVLKTLLRHAELKRESVFALVVGDGSSPRTGAVLSRWLQKESCFIVSVDPNMRIVYVNSLLMHAPHLKVLPCKIEDVNFEQFEIPKFDSIVVVALHSHAPHHLYLEELMRMTVPRQDVTVLSVPCCEDLTIPREVCEKWGLKERTSQIAYDMLTPKSVTTIHRREGELNSSRVQSLE